MSGDPDHDEGSALHRHQAVGAYQRWVPPSFDAPRPPAPRPAATPKTPPAPAPQAPVAADPDAELRRLRQETEAAEAARRQQEAEEQQRALELAAEQQRQLEAQMAARQQLQLPTAEEIEQIYEQARKEGYEAGHTTGLADGHAEGHAQGLREGFAAGEAESREQLAQRAEALARTIASLDAALGSLDQHVADELLALAVEIARKMCMHSIDRPDNLIALVQDTLQQIPQRHLQIHLHPQDAAHVRARLLEGLEDAQHRIVEDDTLTPGGCILTGDGTHLDATVQTRWRRILGELGMSGTEAVWELPPGETPLAPVRTAAAQSTEVPPPEPAQAEPAPAAPEPPANPASEPPPAPPANNDAALESPPNAPQ